MEIRLLDYTMIEIIKPMILQILGLTSTLQQIQDSVVTQKAIFNSNNVLVIMMAYQAMM